MTVSPDVVLRGCAHAMSWNAELAWMLVLFLFLTAAPGVAAGLFAVRRGVAAVPLVLAIALAASGLAAFGSFWAYYASPTLGQAWDFLVLFGSVQLGAWAVYRGGLDRDLLRALLTPLLLWVLGSVFVVYFGFLHGGTGHALGVSSARFSGPLPPDNDIPRFFADWFAAHGSHGTPPLFINEWHMSDRPPLQVGYVLSQRAFLDDTAELRYEVLCVIVQCLWIVGMWALLCAARLRPRTRGLAMIAAMVSDVAILHGFFVWPKLIAAAFLLAALALVISPEWRRYRTEPWLAGLLAALLALAMLGARLEHLRCDPAGPDCALPRRTAELALDRRRPRRRDRADGVLVGLPALRRPARQPAAQVAPRRRLQSTTAAPWKRSATAIGAYGWGDA